MALCIENVIAVYDTRPLGKGRPLVIARGHKHAVTCLQFAPARPFALASRDLSGMVCVWPPVSAASIFPEGSRDERRPPKEMTVPIAQYHDDIQGSVRMVWSANNAILSVYGENTLNAYHVGGIFSVPQQPMSHCATLITDAGITAVAMSDATAESSDPDLLGLLAVASVWPAEVHLYSLWRGAMRELDARSRMFCQTSNSRTLAAIAFHPKVHGLLVGVDLRGPKPSLHFFSIRSFTLPEQPEWARPLFQGVELLDRSSDRIKLQHMYQLQGFDSGFFRFDPIYFLPQSDAPFLKADENFNCSVAFGMDKPNRSTLLLSIQGTRADAEQVCAGRAHSDTELVFHTILADVEQLTGAMPAQE
eukprot:TRINITY_DN21294_c0_g1_i1.p1 TRINITY_DN21294_c0_g1~~TRINITY_DN21294_c0_g1_i1.p1  ORF type:complete len:388 (+),score=105.34 TRINITY_DN21294_c0_g1_i1:81-1166(+)